MFDKLFGMIEELVLPLFDDYYNKGYVTFFILGVLGVILWLIFR